MSRWENIKHFFRVNLLSGLLVLAPLAASIYVLVKISVWLYRKLVFLPIDYDAIGELLRPVLPGYQVDWILRSIHLIEFVAVLVAIIALTTLAGLVTKIRVFNWLLRWSERILEHIPLVGMVYSALKQLLQAVFSGKGNFSRVVMIEYPRLGIWSLGFVSRDADSTFSKKAGRELVSVFLPTTPNPTSGYLLMVPEEDLIDTELSIEQAFKIIISAGMVLPHEDPEEVLEMMSAQAGGPAAERDEKPEGGE